MVVIVVVVIVVAKLLLVVFFGGYVVRLTVQDVGRKAYLGLTTV